MRQTETILSQPPPKSNYGLQDLRETELWKEIDDVLALVFDPSIDKVSGAIELAGSPDGRRIAFTGTIYGADWREKAPRHKICIIDTETSALDVITSGTSSERLPKWSPDGRTLAFLSNRDGKGIFQLFLLSVGGFGEAKPAPRIEGTAEDFHWSPDGSRILIQVAGLGADQSDAAGSGKVGEPKKDLPAWMPTVDSGDLKNAWRTLWILDPEKGKLEQASKHGSNAWEAAWCGPDAFVSIASDSPTENAWYNASIRITQLGDAAEKIIYTPKRQLGCLVTTPSGDKAAFIEASASDRGILAGEVKMIDTSSGTFQTLELKGPGAMDAAQLIWRNDFELFAIGLQGNRTVAQQWPTYPEGMSTWATTDACGSMPSATILPDNRFAVVAQSWEQAPEIRLEGAGNSKVLLSFDHNGRRKLRSKLGPMESITWSGANCEVGDESLQIQGFLYRPRKPGKAGLVVNVHGGPCWHNINSAAGAGLTSILNYKGYAVLAPNPRGSVGRGRGFLEAVMGDMGGKDAVDILLGIKAICLSNPHTIDKDKIGIAGASYGGYMASLLPTLDPCFKASVSQSAVTDWHSFHTTTNVPSFDQLFLDADPFSLKGGKYLERSPIMNAGKYKTPVLQTAGAQDVCVSSSQAVQYHQACLQKGVESAIAIYPEEGHGVRTFPALIDLTVRAVGWFERFMPA